MTTALHTLLEHAVHQRDEALAALLRAEQAAHRLRLQAEQLHTYRGEYHERGPTRAGSTAPVELLHCHRNFMQRLDQALGQQHGQLQAAEARVLQLRGALLAHETRVASVRKLLERRAQEQRLVAARQEQRRNDDAALQRHHRGRTDMLPTAQ
jgi:flagellar FliJ protein